MPNRTNIKAPFSLIAYGRSGTSLLFKAFSARNDMDCTGETGNLIFTPWRALEQVSGITRYGKADDPKVYGREAGAIVRKAFLTVFPSEKEHWMQKPIGTPRIMWDFDAKDVDSFVEWYWTVFNRSFPQSRKFSIVRNPNDVYLSAKKYWGFTDLGIWRTQWIMYKIIGHQRANLRHLMLFEELVARPEENMKLMMERIDLPFDEAMMSAFGELHVQSGDDTAAPGDALSDKASKGFSHKEKWDAIPDCEFRNEALAEYEKLRERSLAENVI